MPIADAKHANTEHVLVLDWPNKQENCDERKTKNY